MWEHQNPRPEPLETAGTIWAWFILPASLALRKLSSGCQELGLTFDE